MGLDKWIGSEEPKKKPKKSGTESKSKPKTSEDLDKNVDLKSSKHHLICSKAKCKYQKVLMKKQLKPHDLICPRCKSKMKVK